jgi:membrane protein YdbS with pleckstrin-like domain
VRLHTAAAATDARIPGLEPDEAARLRDRLAELGEAQAAGL